MKPSEILMPFTDEMVLAIMAGRKTQTRRELKCGSNAIHYGRRIGDWSLSRAPYCITQEEVDRGDWKWHYSGSRSPVVGDWLEECQIDVDDYVSRLLELPLKVGDRIGVRESARLLLARHRDGIAYGGDIACIEYRCDKTRRAAIELPRRLKPMKVGHCFSNGIFREGVRTWLEATGVRIERLNEISEADAIAEGIEQNAVEAWKHYGNPRECFQDPRRSFASLWGSIYGEGSFDGRWVIVTEFKVAK